MRAWLVIAVAGAALGIAAPAAADQQMEAEGEASAGTDESGHFGIGANRTLGGVNGISVRNQVTGDIGVEGVLFFAQGDELGQMGGVVSATDLRLGLRGDYALATLDRATLALVFGFDVFHRSEEDTSSTDFAIEGGIRPEYFFNEWLSIHGEIGLVIGIREADTSVVIGGEPRGALLGSPDLLGTAGFTFWF